ncbi:MAG TPA: HD domain-containing protein [Trebonia sp.]|nr:HD domain-containing protein [Trebonia sp.]
MRIPTDEEIRALHEKYAPAPAALDVVYTHCLIVCGIAEQLHARSGTGLEAGLDTGLEAGLDIGLVRAGSLLHDIGVYRLYDEAGRLDHAQYIRHGLLGYELLRAEGLPQAVCRFAARHTGMGLTREDVVRQRLPLPPCDYVAETAEETLVMYADKFHSKTTPPVFLTASAYAASVRRFGPDKAAAFEAMRERFGEPDLAPFSGRYGYRVLAGS